MADAELLLSAGVAIYFLSLLVYTFFAHIDAKGCHVAHWDKNGLEYHGYCVIDRQQ